MSEAREFARWWCKCGLNEERLPDAYTLARGAWLDCAARFEEQLTRANEEIGKQKELAAKYAEINRECEEEILSLESVIQQLKQQLGESEERVMELERRLPKKKPLLNNQ